MKRKASLSDDEATIRELRKNPEFAAEYLRAALEDTDEPSVLLIALRRVAETHSGTLARPRRLLVVLRREVQQFGRAGLRCRGSAEETLVCARAIRATGASSGT
jgi:hypothetical protein